jgi:EpsI family protein
MHSGLRFALALVLLVSTAIFLRARNRPEVLPSHQDLTAFPMQLGGWVGRDTALPAGVLDALGPGEFLARIYQRALDEPYMDFFMAYFPSQRAGNTIHSPQNCLPGAGWTPVESGRFQMPRPDGDLITVNRYVLAKGPDRVLVLYWYQAHGRVVASEYWAKFYLVADAIRLNRTDGALLRIVTPLGRGEDASSGQRRAVAFAKLVLPEVGRYIPQ